MADEAEVDEEADIEGVMEDDNLQAATEEEEDFVATEIGVAGEAGEHEGVLETSIDPQQWALELERVAPKLKMMRESAGGTAGKEWRDHLEQTKNYQAVIEESFPAARLGLEQLHKDLSSILLPKLLSERSCRKSLENSL